MLFRPLGVPVRRDREQKGRILEDLFADVALDLGRIHRRNQINGRGADFYFPNEKVAFELKHLGNYGVGLRWIQKHVTGRFKGLKGWRRYVVASYLKSKPNEAKAIEQELERKNVKAYEIGFEIEANNKWEAYQKIWDFLVKLLGLKFEWYRGIKSINGTAIVKNKAQSASKAVFNMSIGRMLICRVCSRNLLKGDAVRWMNIGLTGVR